MAETLNIQQILSLVHESNKEYDNALYIPSLKTEIPVHSMNAGHLKNIIKTATSGVFTNNKFNQVIYGIVRDVVDNISEINVLDKLAIVLQLRLLNVSPTISVDLTYKDKKEELHKTEDFDLALSLESIKLREYSFADVVIKDKQYEVTLNYPSISQEFLFDKHFDDTRIKNIDETNKEALKELFGPLFIQELTQYIKTLKIGEQIIDFLSLSVADRLRIMETLPGEIVTKIINKIDKVFGKQLIDLLTVSKLIDDKVYTGTIKTDPSIFA
jgi:hypothetical protein